MIYCISELPGVRAIALARLLQSLKRYASNDKYMVPIPKVIEFMTPRSIRRLSVNSSRTYV